MFSNNYRFSCLIILLLATPLIGSTFVSSVIIRNDFKQYYDFYKVDGSFILYDQKKNQTTVYNPRQIEQRFTPASTFKIVNSLIALTTGAVKDENVVFKWDGVTRQSPAWNKDTDMRNAFKNSTVWYYQELARRIGPEQMKQWLDKIRYGNTDITGGIDAFWLTGDLRVSPNEQVDLLKKLHGNALPFPKRSMDIVKEIMISKVSTNYIIRSKTGSGKQGNSYIGWYVGYITTKGNVYYFSNCIQSIDRMENFNEARLEITQRILKKLNLLN